jgi:hypothetical protein
MTTIHATVTIDLGNATDEVITLGLITHGRWVEDDLYDRWHQVLDVLHAACARQGWLLEGGHESDDDIHLPLFPDGWS